MISRLIHWLTRNSPDPAWRATGIRYTTETHYCEARAVSGRARALVREDAIRTVHAGGERRQTVVAMERRRA